MRRGRGAPGGASCPRLTLVTDPKGGGRANKRPRPPKTLARVVSQWDAAATRREGSPPEGWLDHPFVFREIFQARVTGDAGVNWLESLMARAGIQKGGAWASLGCGTAREEIEAGRRDLWSSLAAFDASPASLAIARDAAAAAHLSGIRFQEIDLDHFRLPEASFDVVFMNMSLHHVRELRPALEAIRAALAPGGALLLNEFVGARQFQFPDAQLAAVRVLLEALPERSRIDATTGRPKSAYVRMPPAHWDVEDPSEAIRSDLILPEVERLFEVVVRADYGGTVLNLLLEHIVHNFDGNDEKDASLLRLLAAAEALLVDCGALPNDFTAIVARPRASVLDTPLVAATRGEARLLRPFTLSDPRDPVVEMRLAELAAMRGSRGWRLLQTLRALFGRRW